MTPLFHESHKKLYRQKTLKRLFGTEIVDAVKGNQLMQRDEKPLTYINMRDYLSAIDAVNNTISKDQLNFLDK